MSGLTKVVLFVSSYAPLLTLFWLLGSFGPGLSTAAGVVAGGSVILLVLVWLLLTRHVAKDVVSFTEARNRDSDVMSYVVSYVVPFAAAATPLDDGAMWALVLFAALIGVLYMRSAIFYVHPLLLMAGLHAYDVSKDGVPATLLTRKRYVAQASSLEVVEIGTNVYVEKRSLA